MSDEFEQLLSVKEIETYQKAAKFQEDIQFEQLLSVKEIETLP